jgi:hypothetical protein
MGWGNRTRQWLFAVAVTMLFVLVIVQGMGWGGGFPG